MLPKFDSYALIDHPLEVERYRFASVNAENRREGRREMGGEKESTIRNN